MSDLGQEHSELPVDKEAPKYTSIVRMPPIGKIGGVEVSTPMHTRPTWAMLNFLRGMDLSKEIFVEGRSFKDTEKGVVSMLANPRFAFLNNARLQISQSTEGDKAYVMFPTRLREANNVTIDDEEATRLLAQNHSPSTLATEVSYDVEFVPASKLAELSETSGMGNIIDFLVRGCNEFRLGSNTVSQQDLDRIAQELSARIFQETLDDAYTDAEDVEPINGDKYHFLLVSPNNIIK